MLYRRLLGYVAPYRGIFALSLFGFVLFASMDVLAADMMQYLIDSMGGTAAVVDVGQKTGILAGLFQRFFAIDPNDSATARIFIPVTIVVLAMVRGIGAYIGNFFIKSVGNHVVFDLRQLVFAKMVRLPLAFILSKSSGSLVSRITYSVSQITGAVTTALTVLFREGLTVVFLLSYLIYINWKLTLTFLLVAPFIALIVNLVSRRFRRLSHKMQTTMGDVTHAVSEMVSGNRDMRVYGAQQSECDRFERISRRSLKQQLKMSSTDAAFSPTIQVLVSMAISLLVWLGLNPAIIQSMSPGLFVSYLVAAGVIGKPLRQLTSVVNTIQKALAAAEEVFALLDEPDEPEFGDHVLDKVRGDIRFDNVMFRYPGARDDTLRQVSFTIKAGEMVALVGASGGGKTTIAGLIPRFFNATGGEIYLDDVPVSQIRLASLRKHISFVSQNVVLLNDTIRNNIAYGELAGASDEQVREAARLANAESFILQMDNGYDSYIGDNGLRLSGGQRQRIAIARAILKNAPVLILDEATSALDNESERMIQAALQGIAGRCTMIVIAHRLSTIERADRILVIDQGEVVEQGSHHELLALNGYYAGLHQQHNEQGFLES
ncbi:MAG TPA: lipid A export permease/ATP-binding protein MsbA [Pseudomonadales bacterium]